jgi:hypothetical protein
VYLVKPVLPRTLVETIRRMRRTEPGGSPIER